MLAAPVAFSLRYVYIFALGLPFFLRLPVLMEDGRLKNGEGGWEIFCVISRDNKKLP